MADEPSTRKGVKTTEFWTTLVGTVSVAAPAVCAALSGWGAAAAVLGTAAGVLPAVYIWGRSILKAEQARSTNIVPDKLEPLLERVLDLAETVSKAIR